MKKKGIIYTVIAVVIIGGGLAWYLLGGTGGASAAVATVNGTAITRGELDTMESQIATQSGLSATSTAVRSQFESAALESLIGQQLLIQAARQAGYAASSTAVDTQVAQAKSQFKSQSEFDSALATQGLTESQFRERVSENLTIRNYLDNKLALSSATATPKEIQAAYDNIAQSSSNTPPLSQVRDQVAQLVVQQKQQKLVGDFISQLRAKADVKILISTSTPAAPSASPAAGTSTPGA